MKKIKTNVIVGIIVAVVVIGGIYLASVKRDENVAVESETTDSTVSTSTPATSTTTTQTTSSTKSSTATTTVAIPSNWQTIVYGGATFRYPPGWQRFQKNLETKPGSGTYYTKDYIFSTDYPSFEIIFGLSEPYSGATNPSDVYEIKKVKGVYFSISKMAPKAEKDIFTKIVGSVK